MSFVVVARYRTQTGAQDDLLPLLDEMARQSRREPACLGYRVHQSVEDPQVVVLYEEYENEAGFTAHCASEHFQRIVLGQVVPKLESREVTRLAPREETR